MAHLPSIQDVRKLADGTATGHPLDAMWNGIDRPLEAA